MTYRVETLWCAHCDTEIFAYARQVRRPDNGVEGPFHVECANEVAALMTKTGAKNEPSKR